MPTYLVTDPNTGRKVKLTGDTPPTDSDLDEIFSSLKKTQRLSSEEVNKLYPYPDKPGYSSPATRGGSGIRQSGQLAAYRDKVAEIDRLREMAKTEPEKAAMIAQMGEGERALVGIGSGLSDIQRGAAYIDEKITPDWWPVGKIQAPREETGMQGLEDVSKMASTGRVVGQALPFLPAGLGVGNLATIPGRVAAGGLVGGTEGATIAAGTGGDIKKGALVGAALGGGFEIAVPIVSRIASSLIRKFKGKEPSVPPIDENLNPSPELKEVLDGAGISMDDLLKQADTKQLAGETAGAALSGVDERVSDLASKFEYNPEAVAAAERTGVNAPISTLTNQSPVHEIAGAAAAVPGSKTGEELINYSRELTKKAEDFIEKSSGYLDKEVVSDTLKNDMQKRIAELASDSSAIYKQIDESVPQNTIVNGKKLLSEIAQRGSKSQKGVGGLTKVEQDVFNALQGKPTYFDIDRLRKNIGASIGRVEGTYKDEQTSALKDMYSKLTSLQEGVADQIGSGSGDLWRQAKRLDVERFKLQENSEFLFGEKNIGSIMPKLESSLSMLSKGNNKNFKEIVESIPEGQRGAVISGAMDSIIRKSYAGEVKLDANGFAKWYNQLSRSPTNKKILMDQLPEGAAQRLDDLYILSKGLANVTNNRTRTGVVNTVFNNFDKADGLVAKLYGIAERVEKTPIAGAAMGPTTRFIASTAKMASKEKTPAIQAADELLASPEFKTAVLSVDANAKKRAIAMKNLENTEAYKKYISAQSKNRAAQIASAGLIPFLVSEEKSND